MHKAWNAVRSGASWIARSVGEAQGYGGLIRSLVSKLEPPRGRRPLYVQTGCGPATRALAEIARETGALLYVCEPSADRIDALRGASPYELGHVQFLCGDSLASVAQIATRHERLDFALLDSAPSATQTLHEFLCLEPRFVPGARILIGDAALPDARLLLRPCRKGKLLVPYLLASPFWSVSAHRRPGDPMVSAVLDMVAARADVSYEDPSYVERLRAAFERKPWAVPAT